MVNPNFTFTPLPVTPGQFFTLIAQEWVAARSEAEKPPRVPQDICALGQKFDHELEDYAHGVAVALGIACRSEEIDGENIKSVTRALLFFAEMSDGIGKMMHSLTGEYPRGASRGWPKVGGTTT